MSAYQTMEAALRYAEILLVVLDVLVSLVLLLPLISTHAMVSSFFQCRILFWIISLLQTLTNVELVMEDANKHALTQMALTSAHVQLVTVSTQTNKLVKISTSV